MPKICKPTQKAINLSHSAKINIGNILSKKGKTMRNFVKHSLAVASLLATLTINTIQAQTINHDEMIDIPNSTFQMGCNPDTDYICTYVPEEQMHTVEISAFKIDKYEVTTQKYTKCVEAGKCEMPTIGGLMHFGNEESKNFPINGVSWYQAKAFCEWKERKCEFYSRAMSMTDKRLNQIAKDSAIPHFSFHFQITLA